MTLAQSWSITTTAAYGRKAPKNNCTKYIGQNKSGKSADFCVTKPNFANMLPLLPSFALGSALLDQLILFEEVEKDLEDLSNSYLM